MADGLNKLLMAIVDGVVLREESLEVERDATAVQDISSEIKALTQDQRADAIRLASFFAEGLRQASRGPLTVDDTTPEGNGIAEALARFVVTPNLGTSQSEPIGDRHYRYTFDIDWRKLEEIAARNSINLQAALTER